MFDDLYEESKLNIFDFALSLDKSYPQTSLDFKYVVHMFLSEFNGAPLSFKHICAMLEKRFDLKCLIK